MSELVSEDIPPGQMFVPGAEMVRRKDDFRGAMVLDPAASQLVRAASSLGPAARS